MIKNKKIDEFIIIYFLSFKGVLASQTVAIVTYCAMKMITTCSPMIGQLFDTSIVASTDI